MIHLLDTSQNGGHKTTLLIYLVLTTNKKRLDTKDKQENGEANGQTGFCPNLFISPPLSVSSLPFFCFTVVLYKSAMLQIIMCCDFT